MRGFNLIKKQIRMNSFVSFQPKALEPYALYSENVISELYRLRMAMGQLWVIKF